MAFPKYDSDNPPDKELTAPGDIIRRARWVLKQKPCDGKRVKALFDQYLAIEHIPLDNSTPGYALRAAMLAARKPVSGFDMFRFWLGWRRQTGQTTTDALKDFSVTEEDREAAFMLALRDAAKSSADALPVPFGPETAAVVENIVLPLIDQGKYDSATKKRIAGYLPFLFYRLGRKDEAGRLAAEGLLLDEDCALWLVRSASLPVGSEERIDAIAAAYEIAPEKSQNNLVRMLIGSCLDAGKRYEAMQIGFGHLQRAEQAGRRVPADLVKVISDLAAGIPEDEEGAYAEIIRARAGRARAGLEEMLEEVRAVFGKTELVESFTKTQMRTPLALEMPEGVRATVIFGGEFCGHAVVPGEPVYVRGLWDAAGYFHPICVRARPEGRKWDIIRPDRATVILPKGGRNTVVSLGRNDQEIAIPVKAFPANTDPHCGDTVEFFRVPYARIRSFCTLEAHVLPNDIGPAVREVVGFLLESDETAEDGSRRYEVRTRTGERVFVPKELVEEACAEVGRRVYAQALLWHGKLRAVKLGM